MIIMQINKKIKPKREKIRINIKIYARLESQAGAYPFYAMLHVKFVDFAALGFTPTQILSFFLSASSFTGIGETSYR